MPRILAIEPDPERGRALTQLVRDRVEAEFELTQSTDEAIRAMSEQPADLILTSALLPVQEDSQLGAYLRQHDAAGRMPVLIISPASSDQRPTEPDRRWSLSRFRRKTVFWPAYDAKLIATRILDALSTETLSVPEVAPGPPIAGDSQSYAAAFGTSSEMGLAVIERPIDAPKERFRAHRWNPADLPWLSSVTLSWGLEVQLVNLSTSGLLIESRFEFTPGQRVTFQLWGPRVRGPHRHRNRPQPRFSVSGRIVRSISEAGGRCEAAATFEGRLGLAADREERPGMRPALLPARSLGQDSGRDDKV